MQNFLCRREGNLSHKIACEAWEKLGKQRKQTKLPMQCTETRKQGKSMDKNCICRRKVKFTRQILCGKNMKTGKAFRKLSMQCLKTGKTEEYVYAKLPVQNV